MVFRPPPPPFVCGADLEYSPSRFVMAASLDPGTAEWTLGKNKQVRNLTDDPNRGSPIA